MQYLQQLGDLRRLIGGISWYEKLRAATENGSPVHVGRQAEAPHPCSLITVCVCVTDGSTRWAASPTTHPESSAGRSLLRASNVTDGGRGKYTEWEMGNPK